MHRLYCWHLCPLGRPNLLDMRRGVLQLGTGERLRLLPKQQHQLVRSRHVHLQCWLRLDGHWLQHRLLQLQQQHVFRHRWCHILYRLPDRQHKRIWSHDMHVLRRLWKQRHRDDTGVCGLHCWVVLLGYCCVCFVRCWLLQPCSG